MSKEDDIKKGARRRIHEFKFGENETDHVSLVDAAANGTTVLTMKASEKEVTVSLSMREFLKKFFGLWSEDAAILAGILGYSTQDNLDDLPESYEEFINQQIESVQLLKGLELPEQLPESIALKVEDLMKNIGDKLTSEGSPLEANNLEGDTKLSEIKIDAKELDVLKANASELEVLKAQLVEFDTIKSQFAALQQATEEKAKTEMVDLVKGYSFIPEEDQGGVVEFLLKAENAEVFIKTLEKARSAITAAAIEQEEGVEAGDVEITSEVDTSKQATNDLVTELLKARNS